MEYPISHHSPLSSPSCNPLVLALLMFVFLLKCYHLLCYWYFIASLCAGILGIKYRSVCVFSFLLLKCFVLSICVLLAMSNPTTVGVMNVSTFTGFVFTLCQSFFPIGGLFSFLSLVSRISRCLHVIVHYYKTKVLTDFLAWKRTFDLKCLVASCMWVLMGIGSSCGAGLPIILVVLCCRQSVVKLLVLKYAITIPHVNWPLSNQLVQQTSMVHDSSPASCNPRNKRKRPMSTGKENACQGENVPPPKRGRKCSMGDEHRCGSCTVWLQTGSNENLQKYHKMNRGRVRHPGDRAIDFSIFLSCNGAHSITLRGDSCMCEACYRDCLRGQGKPRWVGLSKQLICKHCFICCRGPSNCSCECITEWSPKQHLEDSELELWTKYFQCPNEVNISSSKEYDICRVHNAKLHKIISARSCKLCETSTSSKWVLGNTLLDNIGSLKEGSEVLSDDWICEGCFNSAVYPKNTGTGCKIHKFASARDEASHYTLKILGEDGACLAKSVMDKYKMLITSKYDVHEIPDTEYTNYKKILKLVVEANGFTCYCPSKKSGIMYYDPSILCDEKCVSLVYKILNRSNNTNGVLDSERIRGMVKRQATLLPESGKFDYRTLFEEGKECELDKYFDSELMDVVDSITTSDWSKHTKKTSPTHAHDRKLKCMMVCAIMANNMDPRKCFLQTLIGLACYAQGLRDKGMKLLNSFGVTSSIFHIRQHGSVWAKIRSAIKEISPSAFWRATFDNLDFKIKFAKKLSTGGSLKRMLHLLTSQVSFRHNSSQQFNDNKTTLSSSNVKESNFSLDDQNSEWSKFCECTYKACKISDDADKPLLTKLENLMPHWTPNTSDKVVYTTVSEAHSGSADDVGSYLYQLRKDLHVGEDGYPKYVLLGGDQQTYAIMKNLKSKYPDQYDWIYPVPGDWHIMKTSAEVIKFVLSDGGFKVFAAKCGHKGDISQWQDIHNVLVASYEALLQSAIDEYTAVDKDEHHDFWEWVKELGTHNSDQVCCFWSQMLIYLHAYVGFFFAIRSGNWLLRNSCLKVLTELFFAYSRDKYEVLSINALLDSYTYPKQVLDNFKNGEWTLSYKGRPYHSLALDEAQECIVNRKLKQITTRPSHFRMVEMADFMAYLDTVVTGLDAHVFKLQKGKVVNKKKCCTRRNLISDLLNDKHIFKLHDKRILCNIFVADPPTLEALNVQDLLSIRQKGRERMFSYIRQHTLIPPTESKQKRRRQKLKTFTKTRDSARKMTTKLNQATLLLSSAYKSLLNPTKGYKQTFPLPLAICNPSGQMRTCNKSLFKEAIQTVFPNSGIFTPHCSLLSSEHEIIVDFLYMLHQPPPPSITTFSSYAKFLWERIVMKLGIQRGANVIRIVVDKPAYLPKPRELLHASRSDQSGKLSVDDCNVSDDEMIPQCKRYQQMLANEHLKKKFISYLMDQFVKFGIHSHLSVNIILDYEDMACPCAIYQGSKMDLEMLKNNNGEADYNVWYHCMSSLSHNILIIGSDTDIWVYGMAFVECGWLGNKQVYVERAIGSEYVSLNAISEAVMNHPKLKAIQFPLLTLSTIYMLTGGDYISSFFKTSKQTFIKVFIENIGHICDGEAFVNTQSATLMGMEGYVLQKINLDAWIKFICSVYLTKHKTLFNSEAIGLLHASLMSSPLPNEKVQLLKWLAYDKTVPLTTLSDWHDFTRRICFYHSTGSKDHECLLVPTLSALRYHMLRCEYVLKTVFSVVNSVHNIIDPSQYGWRIDESVISIVWDDEQTMKAVVESKGCGCKGAKCDGSTAGCRNCYRMCKPCNPRCKCKGICSNPHNNNGTCPRCESNNESDDSATEDEEQAPETLPLVSRNAETIDCNTDSDDDDDQGSDDV